MKTIISMLLATAVFGSASALANTNIYVNDRPIDAEVIMKDDKTYIPVRAVSEAMGADVQWDGESNSVYVTMSDETLIPNIIESVSDSVVAIAGNYNQGYAFGTGVVIKSGGSILTNAHVVKDLNNPTVIFKNGDSYPCTVQYIDEVADIAVVKISKLGLTPITIGSYDDLRVGETVIAIGTPLSLTLRNTATKGMVSGKDVAIGEYFSYLQSDTATNNGNSGGPLINLRGELVGINAMGIRYADGMSFAIPSDTVQFVLKQFETKGKVEYPKLGVEFDQSWEANIGLPTKKGLWVRGHNGELETGDEVVAVNGVEIHSLTELHEALKDTYISGNITVTRVRNGNREDIEVEPVF